MEGGGAKSVGGKKRSERFYPQAKILWTPLLTFHKIAYPIGEFQLQKRQ